MEYGFRKILVYCGAQEEEVDVLLENDAFLAYLQRQSPHSTPHSESDGCSLKNTTGFCRIAKCVYYTNALAVLPCQKKNIQIEQN